MLHVLFGTGIGAAIGALIPAVTSLVRGRPIDWKSVAAGAAGGAAAGAIASATFGAGALASTFASRTVGTIAAGAAGGGAEQTTTNLLHKQKWSKGVDKAVVSGAVVGAVAGLARPAVGPIRSALSKIGGRVSRVASRIWQKPALSPMKRAWEKYASWLERYPVRTKSATSASIGALGDVIGQSVDGRPGINWRQTAFRGGWGAVIGAPLGHFKFLRLERWFPGNSWGTVIKRVLVDQGLWAPLSAALFFGSYSMVVDGETPAEAIESVKTTAPDALKLGLPVWSGVEALNHKFVPLNYRIPFGSAVGLAWSVFLSQLLSRQQGYEEGKPGEPNPKDLPGASPFFATTSRWLDNAESKATGLVDALSASGDTDQE